MSSPEAPGQDLHLRSANVDFDGNLIVSGTMVHEPDDHGHFPMFDATHLRVSRGGERIVRCKATRSASGFLEIEEIGWALGVPPEFQVTLEKAFRSGVASKKTIALDFQPGGLGNTNDAKHPPVQQFSGWRLSVEERSRAIWVNLSADRLNIEDDHSASKRGNHWSKQPGQRITVTFAVDPITRMACYSAYFPDFPKEREASTAVAYTSSLHALSLGSAPIGLHGVCGSFGKHWVSYGDGGAFNPQLSFTRIYPPKRDVTGFLVDNQRYLWPSISLEGISTRRIAEAFASKRSVRLAFGGDIAGHITGHFTEENPIERIVEAVVNVALGPAGLEFDFQVKTEAHNPSYREIYGSCTICWEVLILRYPVFVKHRAKILESSAPSGTPQQ